MEPEPASPGGPPTPQPPGGDEPQTGALPWEARAEYGVVQGFFETLKLFIVSPVEAYQRARRQGDFFSPLAYAVIIGWVMAIVGQLWGLLFQSSWIAFLPADATEEIGLMAAQGVAAFLLTVVLAPIFVLIAMFIWSAIVHLFLVLVGGTNSSPAGFEGTIRAISYAETSAVALLVPVVGGIVGMVWGFVLEIIGLAELHGTTHGKAAAAVLIPLGICCGCGIAAAFIFGATVAAAIAGAAAQ